MVSYFSKYEVKYLEYGQKGSCAVSPRMSCSFLFYTKFPLSPCAQSQWPSSRSVKSPIIPHMTGTYTLCLFFLYLVPSHPLDCQLKHHYFRISLTQLLFYICLCDFANLFPPLDFHNNRAI